MKKILSIFIVLLLFCLCGCGITYKWVTEKSSTIDFNKIYYDNELESGLNNGENFVGATVIFRVNGYNPDYSPFGKCLLVGSNLKFCSEDTPNASEGDIMKAEITKTAQVFSDGEFKGVFIIRYSGLTLASDEEKNNYITQNGEYKTQVYYEEELANKIKDDWNQTGITTMFRIKKYEPNSTWGSNLLTGDYLMFLPNETPDVNVGDIVKVKVTEVRNAIGSDKDLVYVTNLEHVDEEERLAFIEKYGEMKIEIVEAPSTTNTPKTTEPPTVTETPKKEDTSSVVQETPKAKKDVDEKDITNYKYITIKDIDIHCSDLIGEKVMLVDVIKDYDNKERKIKVSVPDTFHYYIFSLAEDSIITPSKLKGKTVAVIGTIKENETKVFNDASVYDAYVVAVGNDANQYKQEVTDKKLKDKFVLKPVEINDMSEEEYKANCTTFTSSDYNKILRNPNQYKDKLAKLSGKVNQTVEGLFGLYTSIYIKDSNGNIWGINYTYGENESHKLEGDSITVWGNLDGTTTVDNVLGVQNTLPYISAKYIK